MPPAVAGYYAVLAVLLLLVKTWPLIACDTAFYAIIKVKMSFHLHPNSKLQAANDLVSFCISA